MIRALLAVGILFACVAPPTLRADPPTEVEVKAAFVINFLKFVEWPAQTPGTPLVLVFLGDAPIAEALRDNAANLRVAGRPVHVKVVHTPDALDNADAVFIGAGEQSRVAAILRQLDRRTVLTIADTAGFADSGVMLNLVVQDSRIRVEANTAAAARAGLRVSAHLLRLARIVG